ncbi:MAG: hypothetical protein Q8R79_03160 [Legionellaceae bacterium]|nr:hypothetical protein [Legionellaceae bacterium]
MSKVVKKQVEIDVQRALIEDIGSGDVTAMLLPESLQVEAQILTREAMVLCGQAWVDAVFQAIDPQVVINWHYADGDMLAANTVICHLQGKARSIVTAERSALNFLQTLSATATKTAEYVQAISPFSSKLLDTRKTLPGLRYAQKYAVRC